MVSVKLFRRDELDYIFFFQNSAFDMGSSVHCSDNYVQIIETDIEGKETVARRYCGEDTPSPYKSNRNVLSIKFKKTANFPGTGWNIQFMAVHPSAMPMMS